MCVIAHACAAAEKKAWMPNLISFIPAYAKYINHHLAFAVVVIVVVVVCCCCFSFALLFCSFVCSTLIAFSSHTHLFTLFNGALNSSQPKSWASKQASISTYHVYVLYLYVDNIIIPVCQLIQAVLRKSISHSLSFCLSLSFPVIWLSFIQLIDWHTNHFIRSFGVRYTRIHTPNHVCVCALPSFKWNEQILRAQCNLQCDVIFISFYFGFLI